MILRNAGYDVLQAHEHKELLRQLRESNPDLIILDVRMPERDGFWIADALRSLGSSIPIIFMTGCDQLIYRLYAPFAGSSAYLIKPVDPKVLLGKVGRAVS